MTQHDAPPQQKRPEARPFVIHPEILEFYTTLPDIDLPDDECIAKFKAALTAEQLDFLESFNKKDQYYHAVLASGTDEQLSQLYRIIVTMGQNLQPIHRVGSHKTTGYLTNLKHFFGRKINTDTKNEK